MKWIAEPVDPSDDAALTAVVTHHLEAPRGWDPAYEVDPRAVAPTRETVDEQLRAGTGAVLAVHRHGEIASFAWVFERPDDEAHVASLWTDPRYRSEGMARAMLFACEDWARAHGRTVLTASVHPDNTPMRQLNELLGYREEPSGWVKDVDPKGPSPATPR